MTDLDAQFAAAPDATARAALVGIDLAAFQRTSSRLKAALVVIAVLSGLTVILIGVLAYGVTLEDRMVELALGMLAALVPFIVALLASSLVGRGLIPRLGVRRASVIAGSASSGGAALVVVLAAVILRPFGETVELGLAAGAAVGAALPALAIAGLPSAFRRPVPNLAAAFEQMRAMPAHKVTFDGRIAWIVADHAAWQFFFVALVPITVDNAAFGVLGALLVAALCAHTLDLDFRGRRWYAILVSVIAASVYLALAIVAAS